MMTIATIPDDLGLFVQFDVYNNCRRMAVKIINIYVDWHTCCQTVSHVNVTFPTTIRILKKTLKTVFKLNGY